MSQQAFSDLSVTVEKELLKCCPCPDKWDRERFAWEQEYDRVFTGFGFTKEDKKKRLEQFSGGEQTKIAMIRLLLQKPDLLLLDEPTNHLDVETVEWLEDYLRSYPGAVVMVSHDRFFLDRTADTVWEFQNRKLHRYVGNYSSFKAQKQKEHSLQAKAWKQQQEEIERLEEEISGINRSIRQASADFSDCELLKTAFSKAGIPHQIIRTLVPKLTEISSSILGQMTGGKAGIEFQLERMQKNNKEVTALDIYIDEYGKSVLPYLSKSGGEKVRASLSVILALAEIKSSSAGIQLGMLFIDEPPFLDGEGIQAYCDALETIQHRYPNLKIMAITHDPTMKARFPQSVDVVKTENGSKVIYE